MREIKFRAWNKYNNNMPSRVSTVGKMIHQDDFWFHDIKFPFKTEIHQEYGSYFIMQYTGFKDKNGIEIYEGDIVKLNEMHISEIKFTDGMWLADVFGKLYSYETDDIEVIGNIYENPELLEEYNDNHIEQ